MVTVLVYKYDASVVFWGELSKPLPGRLGSLKPLGWVLGLEGIRAYL